MLNDPTMVVPALMNALAEGFDGAWTREIPGAIAVNTGIPIPTMNGVWVLDDRASANDVCDLVQTIGETTSVFGVQLRPGCDPELPAALAASSVTYAEDIPFMVLPSVNAFIAPRATPELRVEVLERSQLDIAVDVGARGFEAPPEVYAAALHAITRIPGSQCLIGSVDDVIVTTALIIPTVDDSQGVFNVATPKEFRQRGYGASITAAALSSGFDAAAKWAWLQASAEGFHVYEKLGFNTLERSAFYLPNMG